MEEEVVFIPFSTRVERRFLQEEALVEKMFVVSEASAENARCSKHRAGADPRATQERAPALPEEGLCVLSDPRKCLLAGPVPTVRAIQERAREKQTMLPPPTLRKEAEEPTSQESSLRQAIRRLTRRGQEKAGEESSKTPATTAFETIASRLDQGEHSTTQSLLVPDGL